MNLQMYIHRQYIFKIFLYSQSFIPSYLLFSNNINFKYYHNPIHILQMHVNIFLNFHLIYKFNFTLITINLNILNMLQLQDLFCKFHI